MNINSASSISNAETTFFLEEADVRTAHTLSLAAQFHPGPPASSG